MTFKTGCAQAAITPALSRPVYLAVGPETGPRLTAALRALLEQALDS